MIDIDYKDLDRRIAEVNAARRKTIIRKVLISVGVGVGMILLVEMVSAESLEQVLTNYLNDPTLDLTGSRFEETLFQNSKGLTSKLKFIGEDIKTLGLQLDCYWKILTQQGPNNSSQTLTAMKEYFGRFALEEVLFLIGWKGLR